jgi:MerC mercury resistance protein
MTASGKTDSAVPDAELNKTWADRIAAAAALACAIECTLLPLVVAFLPLVGLGFLSHPALEITILGVVLIFGGFSMIRGRKKHGTPGPAYLFSGAYVAILIAHGMLEGAVHPALEISVHCLAGLCLAASSFWNLHLMKTRGHQSCSHHGDHGSHGHPHHSHFH